MRQAIFKLERKLIFDAALDLIKEGKFHAASISEISFHAKLTESTTQLLFKSKNQIAIELYDYASNRLQEVISQLIQTNDSFEDQFIRIWVGLYERYIRDPRILTFIDHHRSQLINGGRDTQNTNLLEPLIKSFANYTDETGVELRPETVALVLSASVITHAKLNAHTNFDYNRQDMINMARVWWRSLQNLGIGKAL